jgi:hypothetical protein
MKEGNGISKNKDGYYEYSPEKDPIVQGLLGAAAFILVFAAAGFIKTSYDNYVIDNKIIEKDIEIIQLKLDYLKSGSINNQI